MGDGSSNELLIIGAGVGRTGTTSLKKALEIIYSRPCYHIKEICFKHRDHIEEWNNIQRSYDSNKSLDLSKIRKLLSGYIGAVDHPVCAYFKELSEIYPNSKVILTTRDSEIWLAGCRSTILPRDIARPRSWKFQLFRRLIGLHKLHELYLNSWQQILGSEVNFSRDTDLLNGYINWNQYVRNNVPKAKLLEFDISQGWKPLCEFLQVPVPDCEFPHVNEYNELKFWMKLENAASNILQFGLIPLVLFGLYYLFSYKY